MSSYRAVVLGLVVAGIVLLLGDARRGNTAVAAVNHSEFTYTIPPGGNSSPITLPLSNSPVTFSMAVTNSSLRGTGSAVICHTTVSPATTVWSGYATYIGGTGGQSFGGFTSNPAVGGTIVHFRADGNVYLRVVSTALNKIEVFNGTGETVNAVVEMTH